MAGVVGVVAEGSGDKARTKGRLSSVALPPAAPRAACTWAGEAWHPALHPAPYNARAGCLWLLSAALG